MKLDEFDYELPVERIAQVPIEPRDAARLFVHELERDRSQHHLVNELPELLRAGDLLVVNDTRVRPARLCGTRASGGAVELLVLERAGQGSRAALWRAFVNPARRLKVGEELEIEGGALRAVTVERERGHDGREGAVWQLELFDPQDPQRPLAKLLEETGRMPLPPYIKRSRGEDEWRHIDRERYQTVFAERTGAIAAPTAGLHFTPELFDRLEARGVERATVTLHVGLGTFQPVVAEELEEHRMHAEEYELPQATVDAVRRTRERGGRVVAVGTTVTRVLESCAAQGELTASSGETRLFITPGFRFRVVDILMTNFHLPRSTLLVLISAFLGRERTLELYRAALEAGYRFFSYGDAMLLFGSSTRSDLVH